MNQRGGADPAKYSFDELAIWRTKLPKVKHGILPPSNDRPNPLVTDSMVITSIFSPGAVCALGRETGRLIWRKETSGLGDAAIYEGAGKFFAKTANTLYAMKPASGEILWTFCPYGTSHEWIYSAPTVHGHSVFIGDRRGFLHCLDVRTGATQWRRRTNKAKNDDVNSTPLVLDGLVIVGTNAKRTVAYDVQTGELAWICKLDGPSGFGPLIFQRLAAIFTDSIYLLEPKTGKIIRRFSWKGDGIKGAVSTPRNIVGELRGKWPPEGKTELVGVTKTHIQFSNTHDVWERSLSYSRETDLIYGSHLDGVNLCRPSDGVSICDIRLNQRHEGVALVGLKKTIIYALTGRGYVYALRHPPVGR
jgi:hypothetical protein